MAWLEGTEDAMATRSPAQIEAVAIAAVAAGIHFVVVTDRHLSLVSDGDLERAGDIRRRRQACPLDSLVVTEDDVLVDEVERKLLQTFTHALHEAPSTAVCRRLGLPTAA
jgi:hypothetical protein